MCNFYAMVLDLKGALEQYSDNPNTHLLEYPLSPHDLPDDLKVRAYQNDFSTVEQKTLPSLVITRRHHKLLKDDGA